jgi:hypothetical protein
MAAIQLEGSRNNQSLLWHLLIFWLEEKKVG